ncbi:hypothetical protein Ancab_040123 [Ancistrocladus abbreviatus]
MQLHLISSPATLFAFLLVLFSVLWWWLRNNPTNSRPLPPPPPPQPAGSWPIIGHLCLLGGSQPLHITLSNLADVYGPIFMIKLGVNQVLVVSNKDPAKECLADNDKVFLNRPRSLAVEHLAYNSAMLNFSPYGSYWRQMRKIAILELLSNKRIEMLKHARTSELRSSIKSLHDRTSCRKSSSTKNGVIVEMKQWFGDISLNSMIQIAIGKASKDFKDDEYERFKRALRGYFELFGVVVVSDALPFLRWLDIGGHEKAMKMTAKELDHVIQGCLEEHKIRRCRTLDEGAEKDKKDFMDVMLQIFDTTTDDSSSSFESDTIIKATCLVMILGAADTSAATLTWALSLLLNNGHVLQKVQDELDTHVGKERLVDESDMKNLIYLEAVVKETMRLYPTVPLVPREASTDCIISGYHVPMGTRLFVNVHKIHRDLQVWTDPDEFRPERFLTTHKNIDVRGQNFELIPFGSGRRICPGISFALHFIPLTLANLLHRFQIRTPHDELVDMTESSGLTNLKATPLSVILTPRLPSNLYRES